jgi:hypothetical protein
MEARPAAINNALFMIIIRRQLQFKSANFPMSIGRAGTRPRFGAPGERHHHVEHHDAQPFIELSA